MVTPRGFFGDNSNKIFKLESFIDQKDLEAILHVIRNMDVWNETLESEWKSRVTCPTKMTTNFPEIYELITNIQLNYKDQIENFYNVKVKDPTPHIARWPIGVEQQPHVDKDFYPDYDIGSIIYLNNDFDGGEIYFPQHDIEIKPNPATALAFPGDEFFQHGVRKIISGTRYTMPTFWTVILD